MTDNEVYSTIIEWMISEVENEEYIEKLNIILSGIKGKKSIEEHLQPRFQSRILFGINLFEFSIKQYREMVQVLLELPKDNSKNEQLNIQGRQ